MMEISIITNPGNVNIAHWHPHLLDLTAPRKPVRIERDHHVVAIQSIVWIFGRDMGSKNPTILEGFELPRAGGVECYPLDVKTENEQVRGKETGVAFTGTLTVIGTYIVVGKSPFVLPLYSNGKPAGYQDSLPLPQAVEDEKFQALMAEVGLA